MQYASNGTMPCMLGHRQVKVLIAIGLAVIAVDVGCDRLENLLVPKYETVDTDVFKLTCAGNYYGKAAAAGSYCS